jgi:hypothetical protein
VRDCDISVGLLECNTPERYEALGRMVMEQLMRPKAGKTDWVKVKGKDFAFHYQEIVIHGT